MSAHDKDPLDHPEVRQASTGGYTAGFVTSLVLMLAGLIVTQQHELSYLPFLWLVSSLALIALFAQVALFFGLGLSKAQIWKTVSLVLTVPLFIFTVGLTVWMFHTLYDRTMPPMGNMSQPTLLQ